MKLFKKLFKKEDGATAIEYGLIAALISVIVILSVQVLGTQLRTTFEKVGTALKTANTNP